MPNSRHQRNHRHREDDAHNNNQHAPSLCLREVAAGTPSATGNHAHQNDNAGARLQKCCSPGVCRSPDDTIDPEEPFDAVKVLCNNESCTEGRWMHKDCFEDFEQSVLAYLRSCGRARSWSEKQRLQNLWTKKGYDLAFKACDCRCGRGHLRKDLDYFPAPFNENAKKHKKHKKKNDKPMPVVSTTHKANSHSSHTGHVNGNGTTTTASTTTTSSQSSGTRGQQSHAVNNGGRCGEKKGKKTTTTTTTKTPHAGQKSDSNGNLHQQQQQQFQETLDNHSAKPSEATTTFTNHAHTVTNGNNSNVLPVLPSHHHNPQLRIRTNSVSSTCSAGSHSSSSSSLPSSAGSPSPISSSPIGGEMFFKSRKSSDASSDGGSTGTPATIPTPTTTIMAGFWHRVDLSAFAALPRNKQNPYHIRMEDSSTLAYSFTSCSMAAAKAHALAEVAAEAGSCDLETRNFVLSNLMSKKMSRVRCALCKGGLPVFDRFPLLDGTFFLSPQAYDETAIQVIWDGRLQFLNAACLSCLEGHNHIKCVACKRPWNGCNLVVGSMYTYDIFAASPCCQKRLTCKCCLRAVVDITKGLEFYSQYSQMIICPYCKANDYHFIRSLSETFTVSEDGAGQSVAICH